MAAYGFAAEFYHLIQCLHRLNVLLVGIERGGVCLYQSVNLASDAVVEFVKTAAVYILIHQLCQIGVILLVVSLVFHQRVKKICAVKGIVNGFVHHAGGIASTHAAEGKVIIPRKKIQLPVVFIEVIVVRHSSGKAVLVDGEDVNGHITKQVVYIHVRFKVRALGNILQCRHNALVVRAICLGDFALPNGGVTVQVVVGIVEIRAAPAQREAAGAPAFKRKAAAAGGL